MEILRDALAAVGLICIFWAIYGILFAGRFSAEGRALLCLFCEGGAPEAEHLLRAASRARRTFLSGMPIVLIELGGGTRPLQSLAERFGIEYCAAAGQTARPERETSGKMLE